MVAGTMWEDNFSYQVILKEDDVAGEAPVSLSSTDHVTLRPERAVELLLPKGVELEELEKTLTLKSDPAEAPIAEGDVLGTMTITLDLAAFPEMAGTCPIALLALGYPAEGAHPARLHTDRRPLEELVKYL